MIQQVFKKIFRYGLGKSALIVGQSIVRYGAQQAEGFYRTWCVSMKGSTWKKIEKKTAISWVHFWSFTSTTSLGFIKNIIDETKPTQGYTEQELLHNCIKILGSFKQCFAKLPWHRDYKIEKAGVSHDFSAHMFYSLLPITINKTAIIKKDIKIPWELSRFQQLPYMGLLYSKNRNSALAMQFKKQIEDWLQHNPPYYGPNWTSTMEVAIRSVNWVWGFYFFKDVIREDDFWQPFVASLYDHLLYIESHWERYRTVNNNHYVANLVGYLYLLMFFRSLKGVKEKIEWCINEIRVEFNKQIFSEGTSFEGSTQYHALVTECFYHAFEIMNFLGYHVSTEEEQKLKNMFLFIEAVKINPDTMIPIGDDDSGKIVFGITTNLLHAKKGAFIASPIMHWENFGLSIIKKNNVHISLRHSTFNKEQSSGHFHVDALHVTIAFECVPFLVDPGTYVYTPSLVWRNYFRSAQAHNGPVLSGKEPVDLEDMFFLELPSHHITPSHEFEKSMQRIRLSSQSILYRKQGIDIARYVDVDTHSKKIKIDDIILSHSSSKECIQWRFTFAKGMSLIDKGNREWDVYYKNEKYGVITSNAAYTLQQGWVSERYGVKEQVVVLEGKETLLQGKNAWWIAFEKY